MSIRITNFDIRILKKSTSDSFFSAEGETVLNILSSKRLFDADAEIINADPFLFPYKGKLYLFYERQNRYFGKGIICMRSTENGVVWSDPVVVLQEKFHLSFPCVFEDEGEVYMIPETGHDKSIRLYHCIDGDLRQWELEAKLLYNGLPWVDSSVIKINGMYYLFTSYSEHNIYRQCLFCAKRLVGPYLEHLKSPIYIGNDSGRNAGAVFLYNNSIYRPVQDCSGDYGDNVSIMKITDITPNSFSEQEYIHHIINTSLSFYKRGGHQFSFADFRGNVFVATDAKKWNYNIVETTRKIKNRLSK